MVKEEHSSCSPALLAAQQQLQLLRQQHQSRRREAHAPGAWGPASHASAVTNHPVSPPETRPEEVSQGPSSTGTPSRNQAELHPPSHVDPPIRLYPDIALAMLREDKVATGRVWLLLHHLDASGSGRIDIEKAREALTRAGAELHLCGWRQLRKLLAQGEGLFWQRQAGRIWLRSAARLAASLGLFRLSGRPVALSVNVLLQSIGIARAHFYASFHSGRAHPNSGEDQAGPIARETLRQLCHVSRRTQHHYEKRTGTSRQHNFAVGRPAASAENQARAWKHGRALFCFIDHTGMLGRKGTAYTAWQLPNNYRGPHRQLPIGRQKRLNRQLADLFMKGMTGNSKATAEQGSSDRTADDGLTDRRYYDTGLSAARSYNRSSERDIYWRSRLGKRQRYRLWHLLPAQGGG